ncbi:hypothetical protein D3C84_1081520 [compost metagenome]
MAAKSQAPDTDATDRSVIQTGVYRSVAVQVAQAVAAENAISPASGFFEVMRAA